MFAPDQPGPRIPDPRRYWFRAHHRAVARVRHCSAAYEAAWRAGTGAWREWEGLQAARRRERFTYTMLCRVLGWR